MLKVLVICDSSFADGRQTMIDHLHFLDHAARGTVSVTYIDVSKRSAFDPRWLRADLAVLHTTILAYRWHSRLLQIHEQLEWLTRFPGVVSAMPQDEYDHSLILDEWLSVLGARHILTMFNPAQCRLLYPRMHRRAHFMLGLTGYLHSARVAEAQRNDRPAQQREIDVFYRARRLPYSFGWLGHIKGQIGLHAAEVLANRGLRLDISVRPEDTLTGDRWLNTLGSSVATLGSQSGSSVLDRRGETHQHINALLRDTPGLSFDEANQRCHGDLTRYNFSALGPRHLEAISTRTAQILIDDDWGGLFTPWTHYIPLKADLSNLRDVPELLRDHALLDRITTAAYADFVESDRYSYSTFAREYLESVSALLP